MVYELFNMPNIKYNSDLTEAQLTHHGNGDYYKIHNDNGDEPMGLRYLTYVYYFYKEPKAFSNGELRLYRMPLNNKTTIDASNSYIDIEPLSNRLVIFPSHFMHEVRVVNSNPTFSLSDRFTVNGWLHRTKL